MTAEQAKYCLLPGDVLVVEGGSVGQTATWKGEIEGPVGFDKHVLRLRPVPGRSTDRYAFHWARWCYETGVFAETATGLTIKALGAQRAKDLPVPEASLSEQSTVSKTLDAADSLTEAVMADLSSLRALRASLLPVLLSGEVEIPESYDTLFELKEAA